VSGAVRTLVFGVTDPAQALEAGHLGVDAVVVAVGGSHPAGVNQARASEIARALPPLAVRLAWLEPRASLPAGFNGVVTAAGRRRPRHAGVRITAAGQPELEATAPPSDADAVWVRPAAEGTSSATRFDYRLLEHLGRRHRLILEIPDGAAGVETAIRLGRPYGVVFAESVWFRPGIIDVDELERALSVVSRLNRSTLS
jgi:hypothetical protein